MGENIKRSVERSDVLMKNCSKNDEKKSFLARLCDGYTTLEKVYTIYYYTRIV